MAKPAGAKLSKQTVDAITGERRQVTAFFYDIVGSTEILQTLDPEDFGILQRRIHGEAAAAIRGNGGYLESLHGDGGSAYFGFPVSLEDAAESAVSAALELVARCRAAGESIVQGTPLRVRVGIATGTVVISDLSGADLPLTKEVIGITPALAARIQSEAEPNSVAVSDTTYRLTHGAFDFEPLGERRLKGLVEPVRLWKPIARRDPIDRFSTSGRMLAPLVGREEELALCRDRLLKAQEGHGQVILLVGEAGIGKSRLVAELRQGLTPSEAEVRIFQCLSRGNGRPLHPFLDMLRHQIRRDRPESTGLTKEEILDSLLHDGVALGEDAANILAFQSGGSALPTGEVEPIERTADELRQSALDAIIDVLKGWSRHKPQLALVEDVHWADTLTLELIDQLADRIRHLPILAVLTSRDDTVLRGADHSNSLTITLPHLEASHTPKLLEAIWEQPLPPGLASFIHDRSDGIPLFAEELGTLFKERFGGTASTIRDWSKVLHEGSIVTLQDLVSARLAALGPARRIAQVASVIGREFSGNLLKRLADGEDEAAFLDDALAQLIHARIVQRQETDDVEVFRFRHALIQEAAYDSLLRVDRRRMHDRLVDLVLDGDVAPPPDEVTAWHCEQAGRWIEGARYAVKAAEDYALRSAIREADQLLARAEEDLSHCEAGPDVDELSLQLLAARGPIAIALFGKGSPEARAVYDQGVAICRRRGVEDRERWFPLYWGWWYTSPDRQTKRSRAEVLISDLDKANDPEIRLQALHCAWAANFHAGQHHLCLDCINKGLTLYDSDRGRLSRARYGGHDANVCGLGERAQLLWLMGDNEGAIESMSQAMAWAEATDHPGSLCHALDNAILLASYQHDASKVSYLAQRMRALADEHDLPEVRAKSRIFAGWAQAILGDLKAGLLEFEEGVKAHRAIGTDEDMPVYCSLWAELLVKSQQPDKGLSILTSAIAEAERAGNLVWLPELYRLRAVTLQAHQPNETLSLQDLDRSISLAEDQGAAALAARARADRTRFESQDRQ
ncbi:ATP-binding protein [Microvirga subterranea]|uniref:Adenylate/guanylate cyclase family protein n=1 Tax=Microvirga subterranea TaxID=186651 RepID=A0A370HQI6_9HYPH|nr:AAA family ATPase [Microvirga subterranea]RDI60802.1 adenylate/guanylate cyclase family protein [Microvirga subterranea]